RGSDATSIRKETRNEGVMKGQIGDSADHAKTVEALISHEFTRGQGKRVSTKMPYMSTGRGHRVALIGFGKKENIVRSLHQRGCDVTVLPHDSTAETIMQMKPDGVMLSNGPGNPEDVTEAIGMLKELIGQVPIFGICLGHQL